MKKILLWVQICGITLHFLTYRMVIYIGRHLRNFLETYFSGDGAVLVDYVWVKLLWNIDVPLRFQRLFQFREETSLHNFLYEKLRNFCTTCGLISYDASDCIQYVNEDPEAPDRR